MTDSIEVTVFVPRGSVRADEIKEAALLAAATQIPDAAIHVTPTINDASDVKTDSNGKEGRDYTVTVTWTPRPTRATTAEAEDEQPGTVEKVLKSLQPLDLGVLTTGTVEDTN